MTPPSTDDGSNVPSEMFFRSVFQRIRHIAAENYKLTKISIRLVDTEGSRLSRPIEITGVTKKGKKIHYFGKIIGNSDVFTYRSIQYLKNVYLQLHNKTPIFGVFETPEEMAQSQYQILKRIHINGIPTAKPYGCHWLQDGLWLIITEYLDTKPLSSIEKIDSKQINIVFSYLKKMHKKKIYHGDLKPDNIVIGQRIYIIDVGHLRKDVPRGEKQAYDLACIICSFLNFHPTDQIIKIAKKYYSLKKLRHASNYIELVQMRPDIHFNDEMKKKLLHHLSMSSGKFTKK
jgi:tRNA A-37 threonylcarbamoyl transferase component Bud32